MASRFCLCAASILSLLALVFSYADPDCNVREDPKSKRSLLRAGVGAFTYDKMAWNGPDKWGLINCPGYYTCKTGNYQSPINVKPAKAWIPRCRLNLELYTKNDARFQYRYAPNDFTLRCAEGYRVCGTITYRGKPYDLLQVHLHSPSENTWEGVRFPMELHIVHQNVEDNSIAVLAVFVKQDPADKINLDLEALLNTAMAKSNNQTVNLKRMLAPVAANPRPCTFMGSLTTPPCSEGIKWVVTTTPIFASAQQIANYRTMVGMRPNNRPIQSSLGRSIRCFLDDAKQKDTSLPFCNESHY